MGLFDLLRRFLGFSRGAATPPLVAPAPSPRDAAAPTARPVAAPASSPAAAATQPRIAPRLDRLRYQSSLIPTSRGRETVNAKPYRFAFPDITPGRYLDLSQDSDDRWLEYYGLPVLRTPDDLAAWLGVSIGQLAWLAQRTLPGDRPANERQSHYVQRWLPKRSGGWRLIEHPKPQLADVQERILRRILDHVPPHRSVHGFVAGRSIVTNAQPHVGQRFLVKFDLEDFYGTVRYGRVVAIFRSLGFSREIGIWLARLCTSAAPLTLKRPDASKLSSRLTSRHLPQGACTSPALANLSAFGLDVRLAGLAAAYGMKYTRYADDLTFSGPPRTVPALPDFLTLVQQIIRSERFVQNKEKRRVVRDCQQQRVTGVVVNEKPNVSRKEYDRLKAILYNCVRNGPSTQNRDNHPHFPESLRGRIAHVLQLNARRGERLMELYNRIDWKR